MEVTEAYYDASTGGATTVPIGVNLTLGVDIKASFTPIRRRWSRRCKAP
jgi:hypothetical protein